MKINSLFHQKADMAVAPLTMTPVRKSVVDFSNAFQDVSVTALIKVC